MSATAQSTGTHRRQTVSQSGSSIDIHVGSAPFELFGREMRVTVGKPRLAVVVTAAAPGTEQASPADATRAADLSARLSEERFAPRTLVLSQAPGSVEQALELMRGLSACGCTCDDLLVSVGDELLQAVAAHVASLWCGGMTLAAVPTTLYAFARANTPLALGCGEAPHMVGRAFIGPRALYADTAALARDASQCDLVSTRALMVSTALADSDTALGRLSGCAGELVEGDEETVANELVALLRSRGKFMASSSSSLRFSARYGETFAGALAQLSDGAFTQAELLGEGLRFEARLSAGMEQLDVDTVLAQDALLDTLGIAERPWALAADELLAACARYGRLRGNQLQFALPQQAGRVRATVVEEALLRDHVTSWCLSRTAPDEAR